MDYTLNKEIISNIPFDKYEKNFTFVINGNEIKTNRLFADILSPIIRRSHYSDSSNHTLTTFSISLIFKIIQLLKLKFNISNDFFTSLATSTNISTFNQNTRVKLQLRMQYHAFKISAK